MELCVILWTFRLLLRVCEICGPKATSLEPFRVSNVLDTVKQHLLKLGDAHGDTSRIMSLIKRVDTLTPLLKEFVHACRVHEGFLSPAQCSNGRQLDPSSYNYRQHMISRLNQQHNCDDILLAIHCNSMFGISPSSPYNIQALWYNLRCASDIQRDPSICNALIPHSSIQSVYMW